MRDALDFDQVAAYAAAAKITYKDTIANPSTCSLRYYNRLLDASLAQNGEIAEALLFCDITAGLRLAVHQQPQRLPPRQPLLAIITATLAKRGRCTDLPLRRLDLQYLNADFFRQASNKQFLAMAAGCSSTS